MSNALPHPSSTPEPDPSGGRKPLGSPGAARRETLERGAAETARARRHGRSVSVVVLRLHTARGPVPDTAAMTIEAMMRTGTDLLCGPEADRFYLVLPETALGGAMHMAARVQHRLLSTGVRSRVGFAALESDDRRFADALARAESMADKPAGR